MLAYLRRHHVGIAALFVALGGTWYAAIQLPANSAGTTQVRAGTVTPARRAPPRAAALGEQAPRVAASWRYPAIESAINAAGQKILSSKVIIVPANAPWVNTGQSIAPGERFWADTRRDGTWSGNPRYFPYSDAKGLLVYPGAYRIDARAQVDSLIGFIGGRPPNVPEVSERVSTRPGGPGGVTNPGFVAVGNSLRDLKPATTGQVWLRNNDNTNYISDVGRQIVKVIVTVPKARG